jgi:PBP1b-binding outer membrane lipoprotein LpoB
MSVSVVPYRGRRCWAGLVVAVLVLPGCTGSTKRVDPDRLSDKEVGTGLTSQDFRSVCQRMARSLVAVPAIQSASTPPTVAIEPVVNRSSDLIDGTEFARKIRTELIKHAEGRVQFVDREVTNAVDSENRAKRRGKVTGDGDGVREGADYFLTGRIFSIDNAAGKGATSYFRLSFRLTKADSAVIVWEDDYEVKKESTTGHMYR